MLHYYLEIHETSDSPDAQEIRVEVADMADAQAQRDALVAEYFVGVPYLAKLHTCGHDNDPPQPCVLEDVP